MPNLTPSASWDDVPRIETNTPLLGGPGGPLNNPAQALLNRTEALASGGGALIVKVTNPGDGAVDRPILYPLVEMHVSTAGFGDIGLGSEDIESIQKAFDECEDGGTVKFPAGLTIKLNSAQSVLISKNNITVDFNGCSFVSSTPNSNPMFAVIPQSLVSSGRLSGTDYPSSWRISGTPSPVDGDFDCMAHEHVIPNRLKNIRIIGARVDSSCTRTFIKAYSVDGFTLSDNVIEPAGYSAIRINHCKGICIDDTNTLGGSGTYTAFLLKCSEFNISAKFTSTVAIRACSAKGVLHEDDVSIFSDFSPTSTAREFNSTFSGVVVSGRDGVFWDTCPDYSDDPMGEQGGTPIGFAKGSWYGKGSGLLIADATLSMTSCSPGANGNAEGRAVWVSAPHTNVTISGNRLADAIIFASGVSGLFIDDNYLKFSRGIGYAWDIQGDSVTGTVATNFSVSDNKIHGWTPIGTTTTVTRSGYSNGSIEGNKLYNPASGTVNFISTVSNYLVNSDNVYVENNRVFHSDSSPTVVNLGSQNAHGYRSNNVSINTSTGAKVTDGIQTQDIGSSGFVVNSTDDSTGQPGLTFKGKDGVGFKGQYFFDAVTNTLRWYVASANRFEMGSSFFRPIADDSLDFGGPSNRVRATYSTKIYFGAGNTFLTGGSGSPEGVLTAPVGSLYTRSNGGANTTLYVKETGSGNTGWVAK